MIALEDILPEIQFKAVRSSGSGGQHVNKVSSKIELRFDLKASKILTDEHKDLLIRNISERLTKNDLIILQCDETRSQHRNKEIVVRRLMDILNRGLTEQKVRKPTKIPKAAKAHRLKAKRLHAEKKTARKKPKIE